MPCTCVDQSKGCTDGYWCLITQSHMDWEYSRAYCSTSANYEQCPYYSGERVPQDALTEEVCDETLECFRNAVQNSTEYLCQLLQEIADVIIDTGYEELIRFYNRDIVYSGVFDLPSASGCFQEVAVTTEDSERAEKLESAIDGLMAEFSPQVCSGGSLGTQNILNISDDDFNSITKVIYSCGGAVPAAFDEPDIDNICQDAASGLFKEIKEAIEIFIYGLEADLGQIHTAFDQGVAQVRASANHGGRAYGGSLPGWPADWMI